MREVKLMLFKKSIKWNRVNDTWTPETGDKIEGVLENVEHHVGLYDGTLYLLSVGDSENLRIWGSLQLKQLMKNVKIGDYIRITYNGMQELSNGHKMKKFDVEKRCELS